MIELVGTEEQHDDETLAAIVATIEVVDDILGSVELARGRAR